MQGRSCRPNIASTSLIEFCNVLSNLLQIKVFDVLLKRGRSVTDLHLIVRSKQILKFRETGNY